MHDDRIDALGGIAAFGIIPLHIPQSSYRRILSPRCAACCAGACHFSSC